jgi:IS5 family transposase
VECIGKGKANAPYEFGVKASVVTTNAWVPGDQYVLHARTLPGNPYDGHTLGAVIEATERLTGREIERAYVDKGYRRHDAPTRAASSSQGQKRGVFGRIKRELRRRSAIEAVIGYEGRRPFRPLLSQSRAGDGANVILSAVGYNLRLVLAWLRMILRVVLLALLQIFAIQPALKPAS